jgi:hypothetical protein
MASPKEVYTPQTVRSRSLAHQSLDPPTSNRPDSVIELQLEKGRSQAGVSLEHRFEVKCLARISRTFGVLFGEVGRRPRQFSRPWGLRPTEPPFSHRGRDNNARAGLSAVAESGSRGHSQNPRHSPIIDPQVGRQVLADYRSTLLVATLTRSW